MGFFPRTFQSLPPLPRQHSAVIGCSKNYQPIRSHCVESYEGLLQRWSEGGVAVNCEKTQFFLNTLYFPWEPPRCFYIESKCTIFFNISNKQCYYIFYKHMYIERHTFKIYLYVCIVCTMYIMYLDTYVSM